jgi:FimV-like protein
MRFLSACDGKRDGTAKSPTHEAKLVSAPEFSISIRPRGSKIGPAQAIKPPAMQRVTIEVAPDQEMLYLNLARAYVQKGDRSRARDVLRQLLARQPASSLARKALSEQGEQ